jgi:putative NIF3 family GTP cyclohydrolase 1 type 2
MTTMTQSRLSRREFATLVAGAPLVLSRRAPAAPLTAGDLLARMRQHLGVPWKVDTIDGIKAGDPTVAVTGVVTTALASLAVLRQAVEAGANVVVTHEPAFYASDDARVPPPARGGFQTTPPPGAETRPDPVYAAKNGFVDRHRLVVVRLRDHWRARQPSPFAQALGVALGWQNHQADNAVTCEIPLVALDRLASHVGRTLGVRGGMRVMGSPGSAIRRVALLPGSTPLQAALDALPGVDAIIAGEVREWETVEYARDVIHAGHHKGLLLVGRIVSEEPGMRACADWMKSFVSEVPVRHIGAGDPYWRP